LQIVKDSVLGEAVILHICCDVGDI
jgi:hypothetical protein